jgi:hypothetical protein
MYSAVASVKDLQTFFGVGSDKKLRELDDAIIIKVYTNHQVYQIYKCDIKKFKSKLINSIFTLL